MDSAQKALLLSGRREDGSSRLATDTVLIDGVGEVEVRELTRWEMIKVFGLEHDRIQQDRVAVSFGCDLREDEVAQWQKSAGNAEIELVAKKINAISGIGKGADKSNLPGDGVESVD